ncbi:MAG: hypothetical protein ACLRQF_16120 [Thomasclavelia ramosa]
MQEQLILALTIFSISTASLSRIDAETVKLEKGEAIRYQAGLETGLTIYINGQLSYCLNSSRNEPVKIMIRR